MLEIETGGWSGETCEGKCHAGNDTQECLKGKKKKAAAPSYQC